MFHNSTTLHHRRSEFPSISKERRLVHMNWLATQKLRAAVAWDYMRPLRSGARMYSWAFGWPLITRGADATMRAGQWTVDRAEWAGRTAVEGAKGAFQMTVSPFIQLGYSRLVAMKRTLWDTGWDAFKAVIKTPIRLATSPLEMARGVRDAVEGTFNSGKELTKSLFQLKLGDAVGHTRDALGSLLKPITRPARSVIEPTAVALSTAFGAQWQTVSTARNAITNTIPQGFDRIRNAPQVAEAYMLEKRAIIAAKKAALEQEKLEHEEALKAKIAADKGEDGAPPSGGGAGGGSKRA